MCRVKAGAWVIILVCWAFTIFAPLCPLFTMGAPFLHLFAPFSPFLDHFTPFLPCLHPFYTFSPFLHLFTPFSHHFLTPFPNTFTKTLLQALRRHFNRRTRRRARTDRNGIRATKSGFRPRRIRLQTHHRRMPPTTVVHPQPPTLDANFASLPTR